ncbi:GAF and ANTAR domain-containing protein [Kribbella sp. CA-293567]|uniref:GAF and ANTAR domain-containing protein n=1 Tax=Kribbella sp. CA-293567 TaxID=3002436 RepID=UPI0022DD0088|nr:GAF and ANTAR domain-containing protein [Kribbella sp. CA-293567]WBQ08372.1 GAF and ANTAR domain-containing protein [Kribbella sp. CA-293567]
MKGRLIMELPYLLEVMEDVSTSLRFPMDLDDTLGVITAGAAESVPGVDFVSISITGKDGRIHTLAPTDELALRGDELQYQLGEGPCLDVVLDTPVVEVEDIATDLRWPTYGPRAAKELGIGSQLGFQFHAEPHARGGVNLYSTRSHELTVESRLLGGLFANLVAVALSWSREHASLNEALTSRARIGQAIGVVMERHRLDSDRAFAYLVRTSQTGNIKLRQVADGIVEDASRAAR